MWYKEIEMTKEELVYFIDGMFDRLEQDGDIIEFLGQQVVEVRNMKAILPRLLEGLCDD